MHPASFLACLVGLAVAAPLGKSMSNPVKREIMQPVVQDYASYGEYYTKYGDYPAEAEATKMEAAIMEEANMTKRHMGMSMSEDMAMDADMMEKQDMAVSMAEAATEHAANKVTYQKYDPYSAYGKYPGGGMA
ncbi:hypothetical protein COCMIDRAFT_30820 [Bipolaris oryzae ATCC 44560]|uniref:Uncharacterized protein n=1 Tax=Bipolaris oryzae ATCC 44560 TaxID=930090 RepID=W6YXE6_COCMI|nr:uncharacterized protein COCMIDRAFT_30820 [Bipolaris oryzae ATCC 44560]EUC40199.1 hypothetical protein COCMIDRAFT_30820 [Bipolaris oryzae ATCC 44560]